MGSYAGDFKYNHSNKKIKVEEPRNIPAQNISIPVQSVNTSNFSNDQEMKQIDEQSLMGQFGWPEATTDIYYGIPYILRNSIKYFAIQMILKQSIRMYLSYLHPDVYKYYYSIQEHATQAECRLLNEINRIHCDKKFGENVFSTESSFLVKTTDAYELYEFVDTCYRKLTFCTKIISNKIGFIQFSCSSVFVPFVSRSDERYIPLFCFSNTNNINVEFITGWNLAYLRFCCLYQGIWRGSSDILAVVSLSSILANLPINTNFFICWPISHDHKLTSSNQPVIIFFLFCVIRN